MKKWYSLIDKIYRQENLELAFKRVKRNNGAPGIDGETVSDFGAMAELNIKFLHEELKTNKYEPSPVRRVEIEKPDGGIRLRMVKMKQWKTYKAMHKEMRRLGIKGNGLKMAVAKWKNSNARIIHQILPKQYFDELGLIDIQKYEVGLLSNYY
ncbi:hypothetical protein [Geosporobacter ferrireducens]|uniref:Group II intron reverse transcriptase/maturase n=1 Tax=Geosporobacter ferrireducens TaxID=1424294 RepID=A0A1D8GHS2_9FIRM|nr:hypothetical protein [Geosporobacter ferrireducens]AOT70430.1 hypothetical protein Gferi_13065 [Geosporobacter ferrireducens]MTI58128.1 hypothetical protein [Geosporobacter ferrireducens]